MTDTEFCEKLSLCTTPRELAVLAERSDHEYPTLSRLNSPALAQ